MAQRLETLREAVGCGNIGNRAEIPGLAAGIRKSPGAVDALAQLLKVFVKKNGLYLQIDTVDPDMLRAAQKDPDRFPNLVVRISGWSARFASLDEKWQNLIINRTALEML